MRTSISVTAFLVAVSAASAQSLDHDGFVSPSGNIHCIYFSGGSDDTGVRCGIDQISNQLPPRPTDCEFDWGTEFWLSDNRAPAERLCYSDSSAGHYPVLPYGESFRRGNITCHSAKTGIVCRNALGAGFELSRAKQRVF